MLTRASFIVLSTLLPTFTGCVAQPDSADLDFAESALKYGSLEISDVAMPASFPNAGTLVASGGTANFTGGLQPGSGPARLVTTFTITVPPDTGSNGFYINILPRAGESWDQSIDPVVGIYDLTTNTRRYPEGWWSQGRDGGVPRFNDLGGKFYSNSTQPRTFLVGIWHQSFRTAFGSRPRGFQVHTGPSSFGGFESGVCVERGPGYPFGPSCLRTVPRDQAVCVEATGQYRENCIRFEALPPQGPIGG